MNIRSCAFLSARGFRVAMGFGLLGAAAPWLASSWATPEGVPVERLIQNIGARVDSHPKDAQAHYNLGRVHGLAFTLKARKLGVWGRPDQELPEVASRDSQKAFRSSIEGESSSALSRDVLQEHLYASVESLRTAVDLKPRTSYYHLGLAYVLEHGAPLAPRVENASLLQRPKERLHKAEQGYWKEQVDLLGDADAPTRRKAYARLREQLEAVLPLLDDCRTDESDRRRQGAHQLLSTFWMDLCIHHYYQAYQLSVKKDLKLKELPMDSVLRSGLETLTSYEAGEAFVRLVQKRGTRNLEERRRILQVRTDMEALASKPKSSIITPIIFSTEHALPLEELLEPTHEVMFDLDGDGQRELWPWVKKDTAFLVWDPERRGHIRSGRQLLGSVSWWMFFPDGYRAMDALDDDRDGWLRGKELQGLGLWRDANGNGVSDTGEVIPLASTKIAGLATEPRGYAGISPCHPRGLLMKDGRVLPTYDWSTARVQP